jgi:hypothetical protein
MTQTSDSQSGSVSIEVAPGSVSFVGNAAAMILHGTDTCHVNDFVGKSRSDAIEGGCVETLIEGSPLLAEDNEDNVRNVFKKVIESRGRKIVFRPWDNSRGEDGRVVLDGVEAVLQITIVFLDPQFCKEVAGEELRRVATLEAQAEAIQRAIEKKAAKRYSDRKEMILLLDIRHLALLSSKPVLETLRSNHLAAADHGFREVWLVGPVIGACVCLSDEVAAA